jgi:preprotein translocase subunit SecD
MIRNLLLITAGLVLMAGVALFFKHRKEALLSQRPAHGVSFVLEVDRSSTTAGTNDLAVLQQAVHQRCRRAGVRLFWEPVSDTRINVAVTARNPGDADGLSHVLFDRGWLEFRLVHENSQQLIEIGEVPPRYELIQQEVGVPGAKSIIKLLVRKTAEPGLGGKIIKSAMVVRGQLDEPQISFIMRPEAAAAFGKVTSENIGRGLAIILDGKLYSAPRIQSPITTGNAQISGQFTMEEAFTLAAAMDTPLPLSVKVVESRTY